jgi:hypothetical protein
MKKITKGLLLIVFIVAISVGIYLYTRRSTTLHGNESNVSLGAFGGYLETDAGIGAKEQSWNIKTSGIITTATGDGVKIVICGDDAKVGGAVKTVKSCTTPAVMDTDGRLHSDAYFKLCATIKDNKLIWGTCDDADVVKFDIKKVPDPPYPDPPKPAPIIPADAETHVILSVRDPVIGDSGCLKDDGNKLSIDKNNCSSHGWSIGVGGILTSGTNIICADGVKEGGDVITSPTCKTPAVMGKFLFAPGAYKYRIHDNVSNLCVTKNNKGDLVWGKCVGAVVLDINNQPAIPYVDTQNQALYYGDNCLVDTNGVATLGSNCSSSSWNMNSGHVSVHGAPPSILLTGFKLSDGNSNYLVADEYMKSGSAGTDWTLKNIGDDKYSLHGDGWCGSAGGNATAMEKESNGNCDNVVNLFVGKLWSKNRASLQRLNSEQYIGMVNGKVVVTDLPYYWKVESA